MYVNKLRDKTKIQPVCAFYLVISQTIFTRAMFFKTTYDFFTIITLKMPRKCTVIMTLSKETIKVHFFPSNAAERKRWVKASPNILPKTPTKDMVVCIQQNINYKMHKKRDH